MKSLSEIKKSYEELKSMLEEFDFQDFNIGFEIKELPYESLKVDRIGIFKRDMAIEIAEKAIVKQREELDILLKKLCIETLEELLNEGEKMKKKTDRPEMGSWEWFFSNGFITKEEAENLYNYQEKHRRKEPGEKMDRNNYSGDKTTVITIREKVGKALLIEAEELINHAINHLHYTQTAKLKGVIWLEKWEEIYESNDPEQEFLDFYGREP